MWWGEGCGGVRHARNTEICQWHTLLVAHANGNLKVKSRTVHTPIAPLQECALPPLGSPVVTATYLHGSISESLDNGEQHAVTRVLENRILFPLCISFQAVASTVP